MIGIRAGLLATLLVAASVVELLSGDHSDPAIQIAIAVLFIAPLAVRARLPWLAGVVQGILLVVLGALGREPEATAEVLALFAGGYTAGALLERRPSLIVLGCVAVGAAANTLLLGAPEDIFWIVAVFAVPPWVAGRLMRARRQQEEELSALNEALVRERDVTARLTAEAERARIAADMRAALASGLLTLAADAERLAAAPDPPGAADFARLRGVGAETTAELRRLLHLLH